MNSAARNALSPIVNMKLKGIDVSDYQGAANWKQVKEAGIQFVYVRCGYKGTRGI